jgi:CRP/FNR family transcriptional regulator
MKPLLEIISDELLQALQKLGRTKTYSEGEEILGEGEAAEFLPIVVTGKVKMIRFLDAGKEVIIGVFGQGEMFAVPPVFDGEPYPATAVAMEKTKILLLYRNDFLQILRESSEFSFAVISWMCEMLREKTASIKNLAIASPELRTANVLLRLTKMEDAKAEPIIISLRRQDIAEMAALTTETTIRAIRKLAAKNLVKIERGKIIIDDVERLRAYLAG